MLFLFGLEELKNQVYQFLIGTKGGVSILPLYVVVITIYWEDDRQLVLILIIRPFFFNMLPSLNTM